MLRVFKFPEFNVKHVGATGSGLASQEADQWKWLSLSGGWPRGSCRLRTDHRPGAASARARTTAARGGGGGGGRTTATAAGPTGSSDSDQCCFPPPRTPPAPPPGRPSPRPAGPLARPAPGLGARLWSRTRTQPPGPGRLVTVTFSLVGGSSHFGACPIGPDGCAGSRFRDRRSPSRKS
jgi:hypothetical protein